MPSTCHNKTSLHMTISKYVINDFTRKVRARTWVAVKIQFLIITVMHTQLTIVQLATDVTTPLNKRTQMMPLDTDLQLSHATR